MRPEPRQSCRGLWMGFCLALALLAGGCRLLQTAGDLPGSAIRTVTPGMLKEQAVDPVEIQRDVLGLANEFSGAMVAGVDRLQHGTNALGAAEALKWKIVFATQATSIASGANSLGNLLDLTVFITMARISVEQYWQPQVYGDSAQTLLESCRHYEKQIWLLAETVLKKEAQTELRNAIETWRELHPHPESLLAARAAGAAAEVAKTRKSEAPEANSVFSLLRLDPLAGLDPATREIAQTRLFAERALYIAQWMPTLMRWQTELLSLNTVAMPEVQQVISNSTQITASIERFATVAEKLPEQVSAERQAIMSSLESQEKALTPLVDEVRQTLTAGAEMSASLDTTLTTFDALMKRFGVGETNQASTPKTNAEPFRIGDYGEVAVQLEGAARQLTELLVTLDQTLGSTNLSQLSAQVGPAVKQVQADGKDLVDYAFWRGVMLIAVILLAALTYHFLIRRKKPC